MQLKTINQEHYDTPKVEIVELKVEQGFAVSGEWYNEDSVEREKTMMKFFGLGIYG